VKIQRLHWLPYHLPFVRPFVTSHGTMRYRAGLLLWCESDTGAVGVGDIAPMPSFGGGSLDDALVRCAPLPALLTGMEITTALDELTTRDWHAAGGRAVACGLEVALLDLLAQQADINVATLLGRGSWAGTVPEKYHTAPCDVPPPASAVPVNATVGARGVDAAVEAARRAVQSGFSCIKLKVGMQTSVRAEASRVEAVRTEIGPDIALRLDANEAWEVETAILMLRAFERSKIAMVEQPVAASDVQGMARVRRGVTIPIAADEAMRSLADARTIIAARAADVLILKPTVTGGLRLSQQIAFLAKEAGMATVVTTTIDTGIGCSAALHLAASLPSPLPACGLATASLLEHDLLAKPLAIARGVMAVPQGPGLGVVVCRDALERYRVDR